MLGIEACFDHLSKRNAYFTTTSSASPIKSEATLEQQLISLLDNLPYTFNVVTVSEACLGISENREMLVCTVMRWSTTRYRAGLFRVYIAARLLRRWSKSEVDLDPTVLAFLKVNLSHTGYDQSMIHKLIAELVRSRHFSVSKFLQWLMARGLHIQTSSDETVSFWGNN